jgi:hypothetical protein
MDTQQAQNYGALMAGMGGIFLFWRIFAKAGMSGALAFLLLVPGVGGLIVLCILAFGQWKVVPSSSVIAVPPGYPPNYPPVG